MDGFNIAIARSTLPQVAAERLRALIIEGILAPGARLNERELSEQLGLSRTPLREAFRLLAAEGLLLQLPNRGVQVVALSRDDVCHAFEVMASLEGLANGTIDIVVGTHKLLSQTVKFKRERKRDSSATFTGHLPKRSAMFW